MASASAAALAALYGDDFVARAATYTPPAGSAAACRVLISGPEEELAVAGGRAPFRGDAVVVTVRKSEIAAPVKGGVFVVAGEGNAVGDDPTTERTLTISEAPLALDSDRLEWSCTCALSA